MSGKAGKEVTAIVPARRFFSVWLAPAVFFLDRFLKVLVASRFSEGEGFAVLPGVFHITRVNNTGAAFGMMRGSIAFLVVVSVACIVFLSWGLWRGLSGRDGSAGPGFAGILAPALVIGGAAGNLYDRVRFGYVVDYLDFRVWPVFNLADAAICTGVFLIGAGLVFRGR